MLDTIISSTDGQSFTLANTLIVLVASIILGLILSLVYMYTNKKKGYVPSFIVTLLMLPVIISIIILLVGNNVARAFSLAGAFSIIRFRSNPGDPKDLSYVFSTLAVGLACGMGYVGYAAIFTVVLSLLLIVVQKIGYGEAKTKSMKLKILVPENLNYEEVFDDILDEYTVNWKLEAVKTKEFGALFQVIYQIQMKTLVNGKDFIDKLRTRNGNLEVALTVSQTEEKVYN